MTIKSTMTDEETHECMINGPVNGMVRSLVDAAATKEREKIIAWFVKNYTWDGECPWVSELRKIP